MMNILFANSYWAPLLILVASFILVYMALKKLDTGASDIVLVILSAIVSLIFVSSASSVKYLFNLIPYLAVVMVVSFSIILMLFFAAGKGMFNKYLAWIGFAVALIIVFWMAFTYFPTLGHMLPDSSNHGLGSNAIDFKNWIYSTQVKDTLILLICVGLVGFFLVKK
jgi:hypothetical protein